MRPNGFCVHQNVGNGTWEGAAAAGPISRPSSGCSDSSHESCNFQSGPWECIYPCPALPYAAPVSDSLWKLVNTWRCMMFAKASQLCPILNLGRLVLGTVYHGQIMLFEKCLKTAVASKRPKTKTSSISFFPVFFEGWI